MHICPASLEDAPTLARLVAESNKDVADLFNLNRENCSKHPSFCETSWIEADIARGERYFLAHSEGKAIGCVATEYPNPEVAYLNRLAVLPEHRRQGVGSQLTKHVLRLATERDIRVVSIGVIGEHKELQRWYQALGFVPGEVKSFPHLPFSVRYMTYTTATG